MNRFRTAFILANLVSACSIVGNHKKADAEENPAPRAPYVSDAQRDPTGTDGAGGVSPARIHPDLSKVPVITEGRGRETPHGSVCGRYAEDGCARSGYPTVIGRYAAPSVDAHHSVGYVGGGGHALRGEARYANEGTFGYDYSGLWFSRRVWMLWSHGDRHQAGAGAYKTDGPRILPE